MIPRISPNYTVLPSKIRNPVVPERSMSSKSMLDNDGLMRFPRVCKVVVVDIGRLTIGVRDHTGARGSHGV
jgi:hypothetical protein